MSQIDYGELFCQAVDTIIEKRIGSIPYDSTYLCVITDDSDKVNGRYKVRKDQVEFDAYTSVTTYSKNMNVYVQVPNGDWNEQKIIVSQKVDKKTNPLTYISPFDSYVDITGNLITQPPDQQGLLANNPDILRKTIWAYNLPDSSAKQKENGLELIGYNRLGLRASFQAWLKELGAITGHYGLRIRIAAVPEDEDENIESQEEIDINDSLKYYEYTFDCSAMAGNPYNFESFHQQEIVFDVSDLYQITKIEIEFYQEAGSFKNDDSQAIPYQNDTSLLPFNIFVKDIYISLGYDSNEFETDAVILYSPKNLWYTENKDDAEKNHKPVYVRWIHKFDNGYFKAVEAEDELEYSISWYQESLGHKSDNAFSGVGWKPISRQVTQKENSTYTIVDDIWLNYNKTAEKAEYGLIRQPDYNMSWLIPDTSREMESIKAIIFYGQKHFISDILTFKNTDEAINQATVNATSAAMIHCEDNSYGNYFIYNLGGDIVDSFDAQRERTLKLYFNDNFQENETATQLTNAEVVEWIIPANNTMIDITGFTGNDAVVNGPDLEGYYHIKRYGEETQRYDVVQNAANIQKYKIKPHYEQTYNNNTIKCNITKNNKTYTAIKELSFGTIGTSGTDFTFRLNFDKGITALTLKDTEVVTVTARLYDYEGKEIIADLNDKHIKWSWLDEKPNSLIKIVGEDAALGKIESTSNFTVELQLKTPDSDKLPVNNYSILKATLLDWGDFELEAYMPIPIRTDKKYEFISGPTEICYNTMGYLESYFQNPYEIHINNTEPDVDAEGKIVPKLVNSNWNIFSANGENDPYCPKLEVNQSGATRLRPLHFYAANEANEVYKICVVGIDKDANEEGEIESSQVWSQPIYIYQNKYPSSILNNWSGEELLIDKENNSILAAKIVAGKKHNDNTFSGVMMGDWSGKDVIYEDDNNGNKVPKKDKDTGAVITATTVNEMAKQTGLFGFRKGISTFGFRDDGTAYIGPPGGGRLEFNGEKSVIESNAFASGLGGISIDFDEGFIKMYEPNKIHAKNKSIILDASANTTPFTIGDNFQVDWDGSLWANNGAFNGSILADYGEFQGLNVSQLYADEATISSLYLPSGLETPYVRFGSVTTTTYRKFTRDNKTDSWVDTGQEVNFSSSPTPSENVKYVPIGSTSNYAGYLGVFSGWDANYRETKVVGILNEYASSVNDPARTVIENAYGGNIRIGNNSTNNDYIILQGTLDFQAETAYIKTLKFTNTDNTGSISFVGVPAGNQYGIYARFAADETTSYTGTSENT